MVCITPHPEGTLLRQGPGRWAGPKGPRPKHFHLPDLFPCVYVVFLIHPIDLTLTVFSPVCAKCVLYHRAPPPDRQGH